MSTIPAGWGDSLAVRYETHANTSRKFLRQNLGNRIKKKLICMLLSLQAAPLDKVTGVGLPVCRPHAANRSNALQPFRWAQATAVFLIIGTIMVSDSRQRWSTSRQGGVGEVTSTQPAHAAEAVWTSTPWLTSCLRCGSEREDMNNFDLVFQKQEYISYMFWWKHFRIVFDCVVSAMDCILFSR